MVERQQLAPTSRTRAVVIRVFIFQLSRDPQCMIGQLTRRTTPPKIEALLRAGQYPCGVQTPSTKPPFALEPGHFALRNRRPLSAPLELIRVCAPWAPHRLSQSTRRIRPPMDVVSATSAIVGLAVPVFQSA